MPEPIIPPINPKAPPARPAIYANGSHVRKARVHKKHMGGKRHSRKIEPHHVAKHGLKRG